MKTHLITLITVLALSWNSTSAHYITVEDSTKKTPKNWFHLDFKKDGYYGVNTAKAYEFLKGKKSTTVIVAVIDSGIDIEHEDLDDKLWTNQDEIAGDGKDNDNNGYVDDIHGWSFISGAGGDVGEDTYELTRYYKMLKAKYEGKKKSEVSDKDEFETFKEVEKAYKEQLAEAVQQSMNFMGFYLMYERFNRLMSAYLDKEANEITMEDLAAIDSQDPIIKQAQGMVAYGLENGYTEEELKDYSDYLQGKLKYSFSLEYNPRTMVGDNYADQNERIYGNHNLEGPDAQHGTHVAGIIGAERNNKLGMDGIAEDVQIMTLRVVPTGGDERDKDVANAIYYAVDNGARVINMSFGKAYSPYKSVVDKAMRYAESKGVLLVHAAGNDNKNTEKDPSYPVAETEGVKTAVSTWVEVGASSWKTDEGLPATFSNYGERVDIFAPGVAIYSTIPDNKYEDLQGTSMASPVTAGVAALVMSYFPELSGQEVKEILLESATALKNVKVHLPGSGNPEEDKAPKVVKFKELSKIGGIVNAYEAVKLAAKKAKKK